MSRFNVSKVRKGTFLSDGTKVLLLPNEGREHELAYVQFERWEQKERLSVVREQIRQLHQKLFELACQLQRQFEPEDVAEALLVVAELKTLKAYEETLTEVGA